MTMPEALHPRDDVNRLYVSRKNGSGLATIKDSVIALIQRLEDYSKQLQSKTDYGDKKNTDNASINRTKITKDKNGKKNHYGHFKWQKKRNLDMAEKKKP